MKMSFNAAQRRTLALTVGCLGGILTDIETVEEIAAMPNHPTERLAKLKALARAATPGAREWLCLDDGGANELWAGVGRRTIASPRCYGNGDYPDIIEISRADAEFIAACDTETILAIVDLTEAQAARIAELEEALKPFANYADALDGDMRSHGVAYTQDYRKAVFVDDFRKARQAYTGDTPSDITTHESTAPYAHPYAKDEK